MSAETHRDEMARRSRTKSNDARDIGPPPKVVSPQRRADAERSLRRFCETYFPQRFALAWSPDHLQVLARMEDAILHGGLFALAMPRGSGKTSVAEVACLWAIMIGAHPFVILLPVSATRAAELLAGIKTELLTNDLLHEDFPEICHPIRALEDRANRAKGQHIAGHPTYIGWKQNEIIIPTVAGGRASGAVLRVAGITSGGVRGAKHVRPADGKNVRPTLAILDDPQNNEVARSPYQVEKRLRLIHGAVLGMAGPGKKITAICPCTVISKNDLADSLLDRKKSPLWTGQRYKLLNRFPDRMDLWQEYADRRADELRNDGDGHLATAWYGQQKETMDAGALAAWPERFNPDELGAVQHALNLYFQDAHSFASEYQNDPLPDQDEADQLQPEALAKRLNGLKRGVVPLACSRVTAFVDVQKSILFYGVCAWADDFTGAVIDYGTYPDQQRRHFTLAEVQRTLARASPGTGLEGSIHAGLGKLCDQILPLAWRREDGAELRIERLLIDANWGASTDTVYTFCRQSAHAAIVMPSHGKYFGAASKPLSEYTKKTGTREKIGFHWMRTSGGKRATQYLLIDTNFWKSFVAERLTVAPGDKGAVCFFGAAGQDHRMLIEQLCAEYRVRTEGRGRKVDEWKIRPDRPDNHWWDCLVGAAAAASLQGCELPATQTAAAKAQRVKWSEVYKAKHGSK